MRQARRTSGSRSKYGFQASWVRIRASAHGAETGLTLRFPSSVLNRPSQEVRRELASGEPLWAVVTPLVVNRFTPKTPTNLGLSAPALWRERVLSGSTGGGSAPGFELSLMRGAAPCAGGRLDGVKLVQ